MYPLFMEAMRLAELEWCVLPVPHGWIEPRFKWDGYTAKRPAASELRAWLAMSIGLGVVCGQISNNLVMLDFTGIGAYFAWTSRNAELAKTLPTIDTGCSKAVLFRTPMPENGAALFVPGWQDEGGVIIGHNQIAVLPPTRHRNGPTRKWIIPVGKEVPTLTLEEAGVLARPFTTTPRHQLYREQSKPSEESDTPHELAGDPADADRFGHLFKKSDDYIAGKDFEPNWIVKGFLPETYLAVIGGSSKSGKSCLITALAMAVASGGDFLGMPTQRGAVLWVAYEESREERIQSIQAFNDFPENLYITHERLHIDSSDGIAALRWWIRATRAKLVVIDPLFAAGAGDSLSDGRKARETLTGLKELCRIEKCAAIVLHHLNKRDSLGLSRERFAESGQILAVASMDILMDHEEKADSTREITLHGRGRGEFANKTWIVTSSGPADYCLMASGPRAAMEARINSDPIIHTLQASGKAMTAEELAQSLGIKVGHVRNRLTDLLKSGIVFQAGKAEKACLYSLRQEDIQVA